MKPEETSKLREISFEIIKKCPNNCMYCSSDSTKNSTSIINFINIKQVIDDASRLGLERLCISGGEPFLHPELINIVAYAKKIGIQVFIYTSGLKQIENGVVGPIDDSTLKVLKNLNLDRLIFNMQTTNEQLYNKIMGTRNKFTSVLESIKKTTKLGIYTEIHFVPMKLNYNDISSIVEVGRTLNINQISLLRLVVQGRAKKNKSYLKMSENEMNEFKQKIISLKSEEKVIKIRIGIPLSENHEGQKCDAGSGKLIIRYDGAVFPCEAYKYINCIEKGKKIFPDNIKFKDLQSIWRESEFLRILKDNISEFQSEKSTCEVCPAQWIQKKCLK